MHIYILRWHTFWDDDCCLCFSFFFCSLSLCLRPPRSLAWKKLRVLTQRRQTFDNMWKMLRRCVCVDLHVFNVDLQMKHSEPAYLSNFLLYLRCDTLCNRSRGKYLEPQKCRDWKFAMRGKQPKHIAPPLELYPFEWSRCNDVVSQVRWIRGEMAHIGQNRIGKGQDRWAAGGLPELRIFSYTIRWRRWHCPRRFVATCGVLLGPGAGEQVVASVGTQHGKTWKTQINAQIKRTAYSNIFKQRK